MRVRLRIVEQMIVEGTSHPLLEATLAEKWGITARQVRRYWQKVYEGWDTLRLHDRRAQEDERERLRFGLLNTLRRANEIGGEAKEPKLQLSALKVAGVTLERLAKLSGLYVERLQHEGPGGGPIKVEDARRELAAQLARQMVRRKDG